MKTNAENLSANVQILERNCIGNQYPVRKNSIYKRSRLNLTSLPSASCFRIRENSDQRLKCACAARGLRAEPKRGFELVVPRRLSLQWHLILNLVPRVFSLSNMAAAGQRTLTHSSNHVIDLSTKSGNLFKMAAKIKRERIWVRGIETGEKQTKWRQRQTQKKLKICKNSLTSHRNMVD